MNVDIARRRARLGLVGIALVALVATPNAYAAPPDVTRESQAAIREQSGIKLTRPGESKGALGMYVDKDTGEYVVVLPAAARNSFAASDSASLGLPVAWRPGYRRRHGGPHRQGPRGHGSECRWCLRLWVRPGVGDGHPPVRSTEIDVRRDREGVPGTDRVPRGDLREDEHGERRPTPLRWREGHRERRRQLLHVRLCDEVQRRGGRYMITAGHCFPNGTVTNFGTVARDRRTRTGISSSSGITRSPGTSTTRRTMRGRSPTHRTRRSVPSTARPGSTAASPATGPSRSSTRPSATRIVSSWERASTTSQSFGDQAAPPSNRATREALSGTSTARRRAFGASSACARTTCSRAEQLRDAVPDYRGLVPRRGDIP